MSTPLTPQERKAVVEHLKKELSGLRWAKVFAKPSTREYLDTRIAEVVADINANSALT